MRTRFETGGWLIFQESTETIDSFTSIDQWKANTDAFCVEDSRSNKSHARTLRIEVASVFSVDPAYAGSADSRFNPSTVKMPR